VATGTGWGNTSNTDRLYLNPYVENAYTMSNTASSAAFYNVGVGYQWVNLFSKQPLIAVNLGANAYYAKYNLSGTNSPFINAGQFDTLNYQVTDVTNSVLIEPKMIYTGYLFQPYILAGLGVTWNKTSSYSESPTNPTLTAAPVPVPFNGTTTTNFAYELGIGVQVLLYKTSHQNNINLFLDYRYMNWGQMRLGTTPLQTTSRGPDLGRLQTQIFSIGLEYQFA